MPSPLLGVFDIVFALKMQIQSHNLEITLKAVAVENGELANQTVAFRNKIKIKKIRWFDWAWRTHWENKRWFKS